MTNSIKVVKLSEIEPDLLNANRHTERGNVLLRNSMEQFGFAEAGTLDKNNRIIGGNHRTEVSADVLAAEEAIIIEVDGQQPVFIKRADIDLETEAGRRLSYYLNRSAQVSIDFDPERILADLETGIQLDDLFREDELKEILGELVKDDPPEDVEPQIDRAAELQEEYGTKLGQLWALGEHRMAVGDCTDKNIVESVMKDDRFNAMITDPPYGVSYIGGRNPISNKPRPKLENDDILLYFDALSTGQRFEAEKPVFYLWFAGRNGKAVYSAVDNIGLSVRALIVWNKLDAHYGNFMAQYLQKHEPCLYCVRNGANWYGDTNETSVWDIKQPNINEYHPTQKPMECMARPMRNSTKKNDIIFDPFLGSGTTLIASHQLNRACRGIEIDPGYAAVCLQRWADLTGDKPELIK